MSPTTLIQNKEKPQGVNQTCLSAPWANAYFHNWKNHQNLVNETQMTLCWKALDHPQKKLQGINPMGLCAPWNDTYPHSWKLTYLKNQNWLDEAGIIELNPFNQVMTTGEISKPTPYPQPSTNLWGKQTCMSGLYMAHWNFSNTSGEKFQYQWTLIQ